MTLAHWRQRVVAINPDVTSCGGVLLTPSWVLTARHCAPQAGEVCLARADGEPNRAQRAAIRASHRLNGPLPGNDLALLELDAPAWTNSCPWPSYAPDQLEQLAMFGWGAKRTLRSIDVEKLDGIAAVDAYYKIWGDEVTAPGDRVLACVGLRQAALKGDSGGPLLGFAHGQWYLLGVLSAGDAKGVDLYSSFLAHVDWINRVIA